MCGYLCRGLPDRFPPHPLGLPGDYRHCSFPVVYFTSGPAPYVCKNWRSYHPQKICGGFVAPTVASEPKRNKSIEKWVGRST